MFIVVALIAPWISFAVFQHWAWDKANRQNANTSYWTMRANLEAYKSTMPPADYQHFRQQLDSSWKKLNPDLDIPGEPPK